jgi:hypothetical protein
MGNTKRHLGYVGMGQEIMNRVLCASASYERAMVRNIRLAFRLAGGSDGTSTGSRVDLLAPLDFEQQGVPS